MMGSSRDESEHADSTAPRAQHLTNTPVKRLSENLKARCLESTDTLPNNGPMVTVTSFGSSATATSNYSSAHAELPSRISRWMRDWITDWWGLELICWLIATVSLLAIVIVLESHKSKRKYITRSTRAILGAPTELTNSSSTMAVLNNHQLLGIRICNHKSDGYDDARGRVYIPTQMALVYQKTEVK